MLKSLAADYLALVAAFTVILLICGCGGEENIDNPIGGNTGTELPNLQPPDYYPITVGNRWVYRNPVGFEWSREVTESQKIGSKLYHFFGYNPPFEDSRLGFFKTPWYTRTPESLILLLKTKQYKELQDAIQKIIVGPSSSLSITHQSSNNKWRSTKTGDGLVVLQFYNTEVEWLGDFVPLRFPVVAGQRHKALNVRLHGRAESLNLFFHSYEVVWTISGSVSAPETVVTPSGIFKDCLKVEYKANQTPIESTEFENSNLISRQSAKNLLNLLESDLQEELTGLFKVVIPKLGFETVWLAPSVGPVKIETLSGFAELIDYEIKPPQ